MLSGGGFVAVFTPTTFSGVPGDLNGNGSVNAADWTLFKAGQGMDFTGLTHGQAYLKGDLNVDFVHDLTDFVLFRRLSRPHMAPGRSHGW